MHKLQEEPLVIYMLDQIKHVIEMGEEFTRAKFYLLLETFDQLDVRKPAVMT